MSRKHLLSGALIALISFFLFGAVVAAIPANQDAYTSDQALFATLDFKNTQDAANRALDADQSTQIAQLWLTVDSQQIATLVSTFTATNAPSNTPTRTITPSVFASPTQEILTPFSATPTFFNATNTFTPTRIATLSPSVTPTELPQMIIATNISGNDIRVRENCTVSSDQIAWIYRADKPETPYRDDQVALDGSQPIRYMDGYGWRLLWNWQSGGGCVAVERVSPFQAWFIW